MTPTTTTDVEIDGGGEAKALSGHRVTLSHGGHVFVGMKAGDDSVYVELVKDDVPTRFVISDEAAEALEQLLATRKTIGVSRWVCRLTDVGPTSLEPA